MKQLWWMGVLPRDGVVSASKQVQNYSVKKGNMPSSQSKNNDFKKSFKQIEKDRFLPPLTLKKSSQSDSNQSHGSKYISSSSPAWNETRNSAKEAIWVHEQAKRNMSTGIFLFYQKKRTITAMWKLRKNEPVCEDLERILEN